MGEKKDADGRCIFFGSFSAGGGSGVFELAGNGKRRIDRCSCCVFGDGSTLNGGKFFFKKGHHSTHLSFYPPLLSLHPGSNPQ